MVDKSLADKRAFWFLFFIGVFFLMAPTLFSVTNKGIILGYFGFGTVLILASVASACRTGFGVLASLQDLELHHVYSVLASHENKTRSRGVATFVVCLQNTRGQTRWFRFSDDPPKHFKVAKIGNTKVFEQFPKESKEG